MMNPLQESGLLQTLQDTLVQTMFTDSAKVYRKISAESGGTGASDGRGGYGDSRGGSTDTFDSAIVVPCRMDSQTLRNPERISADVSTQNVRQIIYVPEDTVVGPYDEIETDAGTPLNNRQVLRYQVSFVVRETEQFDLGLEVNRVTF